MTSLISTSWALKVLCSTLLATVLFTARPSAAEVAPCIPAPLPHSTAKQLGKGKLLIASRDLFDANFYETVILLADYGPNGASGLVINRPSGVTLAELLPGEESLRPRNDMIYLGGPVAQDRLILLIRSAKKPVDSHALFEDVYISGSAKTLRALAGEGGVVFRAYMGYAGWGPGQLQREVERGDWAILPAEADLIFERRSESLWRELIERTSGNWTLFQHRPELDRCPRSAALAPFPPLGHLAPTPTSVHKGAEEHKA